MQPAQQLEHFENCLQDGREKNSYSCCYQLNSVADSGSTELGRQRSHMASDPVFRRRFGVASTGIVLLTCKLKVAGLVY